MMSPAGRSPISSYLDPLRAIPIVPKAMRREPLTSQQGLLLFRTEHPKGHIFSWLAHLGWRRERAFELDAIGARFYNEIDGRRSLIEIQETLVNTFGFDAEATRNAIITYTSELMRRGLLVLQVSPQN